MRTPGGLSDTVERLIRAKPGITVPELLDSAEKTVKSDSPNKRENLRETVRYKIKRGHIDRRGEGLYWTKK